MKQLSEIGVKRIFLLTLYYFFLTYLPESSNPIFGKVSKFLRYQCCKRIFKKCGKNVNIERKASFNSGINIEIGDFSGLGINCYLPSNTIIGNYVMMGPNLHILQLNHKFGRIDIPINKQGKEQPKQTIIKDDVWIGRDVIFTPGRIVETGTVIAAGTVLCKNFDSYSIVGGNPSRLIRLRD